MGNGDEKLLRLDMSKAASYFSVSASVIAQRTRKTYDKKEDREAVSV